MYSPTSALLTSTAVIASTVAWYFVSSVRAPVNQERPKGTSLGEFLVSLTPQTETLP